MVPSLQVFVRLRPLISEEANHKLIEYKAEENSFHANNGNSGSRSNARYQLHVKQPSSTTPNCEEGSSRSRPVNPHFVNAPPLRRTAREWKSFGGFSNIFLGDTNNQAVYQASVEPLVSHLGTHTNQSAAVFTYGHTGSGKTHTLLGYGDELGIYKFAAKDLLEQLQDKQCLMVRVTELYKSQILDLLTNEECSIRQDGNGMVYVRGPMKEDPEGRIDQQPLGKLCSTFEQVVKCIDAAVHSRRVGSSTHHGQSSRSHLVIELEIVTKELVNQRNLLLKQDTNLTRLKWLQTERMYGKHMDRPMPPWTKTYTDRLAPSHLHKDIQQYESIVRQTRERLAILGEGMCGTLVFCDLAGNEYARDAGGSTRQELEEAAGINRSLLAVKEMIRRLSQNTSNDSNRRKTKSNTDRRTNHVPYRDSKLTMLLRRHLDNTAIMMAHISPSQESFRKTINTLTYASMVGDETRQPSKGKEKQIRQSSRQ